MYHYRSSFVALLLLASTYGASGAQQGALVYTKGGDAWIMTTSGANQTRLTSIGDVSFPRLANSVLLFKSGGQLFRTTLQGFALAAAPQPVSNTAGVLEYDLSPDGSRIAITYFANNNFDLYTMNIDGSGKTPLNSAANRHQTLMSWGKDGYIYFVQSNYGNAFSQLVYRIPENGTGSPVQLTNYFTQFPAAGTVSGRIAFLYDYPVKRIRTMNPDGSNQLDVPGITTGDGGYISVDAEADVIYYPVFDQIWSVHFDGSGNQLLASSTGPNYVDYGNLNVDSTAPVVTSVTPMPNPAPKGSAVTLAATFIDAGGSGLALAQYTIEGGTPQLMAALSGTADSATIGLPPFFTAGVYNLCVRASDLAGNTGSYECALLPVYDPSAGFVTGGGWFASPVGKTSFGLEARYQASGSMPNGEFEMHASGLKFKSSTLAWLVIANATATLNGSGELNGTSGYQFQLTVADHGSQDTIAVKIWNAAGIAIETGPVALGGGQVVIH